LEGRKRTAIRIYGDTEADEYHASAGVNVSTLKGLA
jgi:hypothetical protein